MKRVQLHGEDVWGGDRRDHSAVVTAGLDAWVCSRSHGGRELCYVSSCATGRITRMLMADVSGPEDVVRAVASELRNLMRRRAGGTNDSQLLRAMNRRLAGFGAVKNALITTLFAPERRLLLCNLGHPAPLLYRAATRTWVLLDQRSVQGDEFGDAPRGIIELVNYEQFDVRLEPGDLVLCTSQPLAEVRDAAGEILGLPAVLDVVRSLELSDPMQVPLQLLTALGQRCGRAFCCDEVSVALLMPKIWAPMLSAPVRLPTLLRPLQMMRDFLRLLGLADAGFAPLRRQTASSVASRSPDSGVAPHDIGPAEPGLPCNTNATGVGVNSVG